MNDARTTQSDLGALKESIGRYGIWSLALRVDDPARRSDLGHAARELEDIGYRAAWVGGGSVRHARAVIEETAHLTVGTSIQRIWDHEASEVAKEFAEVQAAHPGRFLLGLGVGHAGAVERYHQPYSAMVGYLDALDAVGQPGERRFLAALGPKMLKLARDRSIGAFPYMSTTAHIAQARESLGEGPLLAPEVKVVLESDPDRARAVARLHVGPSLSAPNYARSFLRSGFAEKDLAGGGSDRLVDAIVIWGDEVRVRERLEAFFAAGADHVAVQLLTDAPPVMEYKTAGQALDTRLREGWRRLGRILFA
ncbi:TIGR03620 family F420-dependent LLM class oxidoreductase [Streptomyces sp. NPDC048278]|uniref:TIGR03620 family F420-dependent LLM class oxidoreductase n=1 Tax=Streptomyces sp. NPDC048278 TaxID=3155809 RepID=UPI00342ECFF3